ncbi:MAG: TonB-dependent receptor [Pyrinomonadaceae bacterium]
MKIIGIGSFLLILAISGFGQSKISGKVTYGDGLPLHDASVTVVQTRQTTRTDENGNFEIVNVPAGRQTLLVHLEGFADAAKPVDVSAGADVVANFALNIAALREEVTVTASGTEQSVFDSFQSVTAVGSTRVSERASTSIGEVLDGEPGVAKRSFGPGSSRPVIRGFDGDRVLVMQDGIRTGSLGSQSGDHGEPVDPLSAERIEVLKGPATLLFGSNAIGGVVNVINHHETEAHPGIRGFFTGIGGTADKQAGFAGGVDYGFKNWLVRGNIGAQRTGDYSTPIGRIPNSASRSNNGSFGGGYYGPKAWLGATFTADVRRFGIPFAGEFHHHHGDEEELLGGGEEEHGEVDVDIRSRRYNFRVAGGLRDLNGGFLRGMQYSIDQTNYRHKELEIDIEHGETEVGTIFDNKVFSYRTLFEQQKYGRLTGRFGFEGLSRNYLVEGEEQLINGEVKHDSFSAFALQEVDLEFLKLQFGGRIENNRYRPDDPSLARRSFTAFSGGAGINIPLWTGGAFIANYSHSSRAPALEELYNNGPHIGNLTFEVGNNDLELETSDGIDLILRHQSQRFRFTGDVFHYRLKNYVFLALQDEDGDGEPDVEDELPVGRYEQSDAAYTGVEISSEMTFNQWVGAFAGIDYVRARLVEGDVDLPRIPPFRARVGLDLRYEGMSVRPEAIFAADQNKVFPLETTTESYAVFNIAGSYTIGGQHQAHIFSVNAYNLTDRLYRNHVSFIKDLVPEIGRGIKFGYTIRFF